MKNKIIKQKAFSCLSNIKSRKLLFYILCLVLIIFVLVQSNKNNITTPKNFSNRNSTVIEPTIGTKSKNLTSSLISTNILPKQNMLVYTKYTSYDWNYGRNCGCSLYVSQLGNPDTEQKIYTFNLSKDTIFGGIEGIVDNHVVYTLSPSKLEIISLITGENKEIFTKDFMEPYLDKTNKKVYFATEEGPNLGENNNLYVYDVTTGTIKLITNLSKLDLKGESKKVIYATRDEVYLSYISRVGGDTNIWNKTFDLNTNTLKEPEFSKENVWQMVLSDDGKRIAYLIRENILNGLLRLHVYNRETKKDLEIFTVSPGKSLGEGSSTYISDIQFNRYGDSISFAVNSLDPNTQQQVKTNYISDLEVRKVPADAKGIILLPYDNPDIYKILKKINVIKNPLNNKNSFQWIQYDNDALLFDNKNVTYLTNPYADNFDMATPILVNADNVQFVPSP